MDDFSYCKQILLNFPFSAKIFPNLTEKEK